MRLLCLICHCELIVASSKISISSVWQVQRISGGNLSDEELECEMERRWTHLIKIMPRMIPRPDVLVARLMALVDLYRYRPDSVTGEQLLTDKVIKQLELLIEDARAGWLSDPEGKILYFWVETGLRQVLCCCRGTNSVEGWHFHQRERYGGHFVGPYMAALVEAEFVRRWNTLRQWQRRGGFFDGNFEHAVKEQVYQAAKACGVSE